MLPVASPWFRATPLADGVRRLAEPHAHLMVAANVFHVRGRERDLVFDTGLGVGSLRLERPQLFERDPLAVLSHAHLDHVGGAHEFTGCVAAEGEDFDRVVGTLSGAGLSAGLGLTAADWEPDGVPEWLIDARPRPDFDPARYRIEPFAIARRLADGDTIDLGDRRFTALLLPGHTPGSLALFDEASGTLFSGDVVYDDVLLDTTVGADAAAYAASLKRLAALPVGLVHPGHGESFGPERLRAIVADYLAAGG